MALPQQKEPVFSKEKALNSGRAVSILDEVVTSLLRHRDFIALQLDLAQENISQEDFDEIVELKGYLDDPVPLNDEELDRKVHVLLTAINCRITSPDIAIIFGCPIDQADRSLGKISPQVLQEKSA